MRAEFSVNQLLGSDLSQFEASSLRLKFEIPRQDADTWSSYAYIVHCCRLKGTERNAKNNKYVMGFPEVYRFPLRLL